MAAVRDELVCHVAPGARDDCEPSKVSPGAADRGSDFEDGIAAEKHATIRLAEQNNGATGAGCVIPQAELSRQFALQRGEIDSSPAIEPIHPADCGGAERTVAIKEHDPLHAGTMTQRADLASGEDACAAGGPDRLLRQSLAEPGCADYDRRVSTRTGDYDYHLPPERIATRPLLDRAASRMMVVDRAAGRIEHRMFREFPHFVGEDDLLVLNDTRVVPARFFSDDGMTELLCLDRYSPSEWRCLVRPGRRMKPGRTVVVGGSHGVVVEVYENGDRLIRWDAPPDMEQHGHLALPHYMGRGDDVEDRERYQTVYAREEGAIAAPTAGLHFTPDILQTLPHAFLTLHVGVGTFRPVKAQEISDHVMHSEKFVVSAETAGRINHAGRVIAVGTTVTRVLEALARDHVGSRIPGHRHQGETDIFLHPPHRFMAVDALLTNFHLPQSTLLMLVSAFAGRDLVLDAYRQAVAENYRFYSYGDCIAAGCARLSGIIREFRGDEKPQRGVAAGRVHREACERPFFHRHAAARDSEQRFYQIGEIRFMADDGDAFELAESGEFAECLIRSHPACQPALDHRAGQLGRLAEFLGRLTCAHHGAGEHDFRPPFRAQQEPARPARLSAALVHQFPRGVPIFVEILRLAVPQQYQIHDG